VQVEAREAQHQGRLLQVVLEGVQPPVLLIAPQRRIAPGKEVLGANFDLVDKLLADAVTVLQEADRQLPEEDLRIYVQDYMAAYLRRLREQETLMERTAIVLTVSQLRAAVGLEPVSWEQIVIRRIM
jgi:hypothetical protein